MKKNKTEESGRERGQIKDEGAENREEEMERGEAGREEVGGKRVRERERKRKRERKKRGAVESMSTLTLIIRLLEYIEEEWKEE